MAGTPSSVPHVPEYVTTTRPGNRGAPYHISSYVGPDVAETFQRDPSCLTPTPVTLNFLDTPQYGVKPFINPRSTSGPDQPLYDYGKDVGSLLLLWVTILDRP